MKTRKKPSNICVIYNLKDARRSDDSHEEYDEMPTIEALREVIEDLGFKVKLVEQDDKFLTNIAGIKPAFVLNIAEGKGGERSRESQVPCILESLNIPYSGSDPIALGVTLDKYLANIVLRYAGVPVPRVFVIHKVDDLAATEITFGEGKRFIVKPRWEGSSKGIFSDSVVSDHKSLERKVRETVQKYRQPVLLEEFMEKDEITVGVCGNRPPEILSMMRISPREERKDHFIYSIEEKRDWEKNIKYEPESAISEEIRENIKRYALEAFRALELRDVARIDFRLDGQNVPNIIDINPLPGLSPNYSDLMIMCRLAGIEYQDMIRKILEAALSRCGFSI
jgi:D-alanine-D-alanine ligase